MYGTFQMPILAQLLGQLFPFCILTEFGYTLVKGNCGRFNQLLLRPMQVEFPVIRHDSIIEHSDCSSLHPRLLPQHSHANLKNVTITGFCSARSMIGLTNLILLNAPFLECLTLDTSRGHERKMQKSTICMLMSEEVLVEVQRARLAIARYVKRNVPSSVSLRLIEPCSKCLSYES